MDSLVLQTGEHPGAGFDKLLAAVIRHNRGIGKEHRIRQRKPQRIYIGCSRGDECAFRVNAALLSDSTGLRITKFAQHSCEGGSVRKRQLNTKVISTLTDTVDRFVVARGRRGGNNAHLRKMFKTEAGFDLKTGQVHSIIRAKVGGEEHHLAHFRIIRNYMKVVAEADAEGRYTVEVTPLPDGQLQFLRLFCCPSGCSRTFQHFNGMVSVHAAHLKSVVQGHLFTLTAYDADNALTILAFGVADSEDGDTWNWFLRSCLECFPTVTLVMLEGAKGAESETVQAYLDSRAVRWSRCARHILEKDIKTAKVRYKDDEMKQLWMAVRSRTREKAEGLLSKLSERNNELVDWFRSNAEHCCAYQFLETGIRR